MENTDSTESTCETRSIDPAEFDVFEKPAEFDVLGGSARRMPSAARGATAPILTRYAFFDRSFRLELALLTICVPILVTLWIFVAYYYVYGGRVSLPIMRVAVCCTIVFAYIRIIYGNARINARGGSVIVGGGKVAKQYADDLKVFNLADLRGIDKSETPFSKHIVLKSPHKRFSVPLSVRGGCEMVEKIFGGIEAAGAAFKAPAAVKSRVYDTAKRTAILQDIRAENQSGLTSVIIAAAILHYVAVMLFWGRGLIVALAWGFIGMHIQVAAYFVAERFHVNKIIANERGGNGGGGNFSEYYIAAGLIALLLGMALCQPFTILMDYLEMWRTGGR